MLHINRIKIYEKFINQEELSEEEINIIRLFDEEFNFIQNISTDKINIKNKTWFAADIA